MIDSSGTYQLFVGSYTGKIYQYNNIDGNIDGQFTELNSNNIWDGGKSAIAISDINSDGDIDMIVGNLSGGISYFSSDSLLTNTINSTIQNKNDLKVFPNPAKNQITITSKFNGEVYIYDLFGEVVYNEKKYIVLKKKK